jgi:hypothetical protein
MIIVYPLGVTALYMIALYANRWAIANRGGHHHHSDSKMKKGQAGKKVAKPYRIRVKAVKQKTPQPSTLSPTALATAQAQTPSSTLSKYLTADEIAFLYRAYKPEFWYWEVVETIRRLLLTAVISVVNTGKHRYISS